MKYIILIVGVIILASCAQNIPSCTMSWTCGNGSCEQAQGAWNGNGTFTGSNRESDCLAWEFAFLNGNGFPNNHASSCSCS